MYLRKLTLTNMRAFRTAEFDFLGKPGVHLIVGVNGIGKSTALEAVRILLSKFIPKIEKTGVKPDTFATKEKAFITEGEKFLATSLTGEVIGYPFVGIVDHKAQASVVDNRPVGPKVRQSKLKRSSEIPDPNLRDSNREQTLETPDVADFFFQLPPDDKRSIALEKASKEGTAPTIFVPNKELLLKEIQARLIAAKRKVLAVYYSPHRSIITREAAKTGRTQRAAYVEALDDERRFSIKTFADWWRVQEAQAPEETAALSAVFNQVVATFLTNCKDLQLTPPNDDRELLLTKNGYQLSVRQLSDGERSILTLALDLARRLYLANPDLPNPVREGQAIVLIDELDLHLHPGWQRDVVQRLESTFPKCQIIASTHSPQIIGEVVPENISLVLSAKLSAEIRKDSEQLQDSQINQNQVFSVSQALGMDSNWILTHIMQTSERDEDTTELIKEMFDLLARRDYQKVPAAIEAVESRTSGAIPDTNRAKATLERVKIIGR